MATQTKPIPTAQQNTPRPLVELWGIKFNNQWWLDDSGIVFYTEYEIIATIQSAILSNRSPVGVEIKAERMQ